MRTLVVALLRSGWAGLRDARASFRRYGPAVAVTIGASLGGIGFFFYCLVRWGRWDMYMLTQEAGWAISPDYLAIFKPSSYRWQIPALNDPVTMSQMTMAVGALLFLPLAATELLPAVRRRFSSAVRIGMYLTAFLLFFIAVSGVASVAMESMLRYQFCAHALIVLAFLQFLNQIPTPRPPVRVLGMAATALLSAAGFALQGWYVWNFTRGGWVA